MNVKHLSLIFALSMTGSAGACYVETQPATHRTTAPPAAGHSTAPRTAVDTAYFRPMYYQGYVVYYDSMGRPYCYQRDTQHYIPPSYRYFNYYTWHYSRYRAHYARWYRSHGRRFQRWRFTQWRRYSGYWRSRHRHWAARNRAWALRRAKPLGRVSAFVPPPRGAGRHTARVRAKIRARVYAFRSCYSRALARWPTLSGAMTIRFRIHPDGRVDQIGLQGAAFPPTMRACLGAKIQRWHLGAVPRTMSYGPFSVRFTPLPRRALPRNGLD